MLIVNGLNMILAFVSNYTKRVALTAILVAFSAFAVIILVFGAIFTMLTHS